MKFTEDEELELVVALKRLAVATAEYWDVLGGLEDKYGKEFTTPGLVESLAGECSHPPETSNLKPADVLRSFYAHLEE